MFNILDNYFTTHEQVFPAQKQSAVPLFREQRTDFLYFLCFDFYLYPTLEPDDHLLIKNRDLLDKPPRQWLGVFRNRCGLLIYKVTDIL